MYIQSADGHHDRSSRNAAGTAVAYRNVPYLTRQCTLSLVEGWERSRGRCGIVLGLMLGSVHVASLFVELASMDHW